MAIGAAHLDLGASAESVSRIGRFRLHGVVPTSNVRSGSIHLLANPLQTDVGERTAR